MVEKFKKLLGQEIIYKPCKTLTNIIFFTVSLKPEEFTHVLQRRLGTEKFRSRIPRCCRKGNSESLEKGVLVVTDTTKPRGHTGGLEEPTAIKDLRPPPKKHSPRISQTHLSTRFLSNTSRPTGLWWI